MAGTGVARNSFRHGTPSDRKQSCGACGDTFALLAHTRSGFAYSSINQMGVPDARRRLVTTASRRSLIYKGVASKWEMQAPRRASWRALHKLKKCHVVRASFARNFFGAVLSAD